MARRLVLGCGSIGHAVVVALSGRRGELTVIDPDADRVETLRTEGIPAERGDPTDPAAIATDDAVEAVFVAGDDPMANLTAARVARDVHPAASVVVYAGEHVDAETRAAIEDVADRTVDRGRTVVDHVLGTIESEDGPRLFRLHRVLRDIDGQLGVFTHDNPDPDAIASAVALSRIADRMGVTAEVCYYGEITHQENRAFINLLEFELTQLDPDADLAEYGGFALVDHSRPGVNDQLDPDTEIDVVVDHHPPRGPVEARFVDLRPEVGATSTIITDYFDRLGEPTGAEVAGALLYGIRIDTKEFTREVSTADFQAAASLIGDADAETLRKIESPSVSAEVLELIATAIRNRSVRGSTLTTCVGRVLDRDALAQAAEQLLNIEEVTTTLVYGFADGTVYVSGRARGADVDLGEVLRDAFDQIGSAGGHADMAGAQIPLGILGDTQDTDVESLSKNVTAVIDERFFEALAETTAPIEGTGFTYELGPRSLDADTRTAFKVRSGDQQTDADFQTETSEE
jgi:nanoRNase/pAp phosphatase (c-di-AMP/oligoRNAs hydrolase)